MVTNVLGYSSLDLPHNFVRITQFSPQFISQGYGFSCGTLIITGLITNCWRYFIKPTPHEANSETCECVSAHKDFSV